MVRDVTKANDWESFDNEWLALREPVDHEARSETLLPIMVAAARTGGWSRIVDLASGTGSNLRYLAPHLPKPMRWTLIDHDEALLRCVKKPDRVQSVVSLCGNIATDGIASVADADLVTGAALLDLVSESWLRTLAEACRSSACGVLFALTYNGCIDWDSLDCGDAMVQDAVNRHQGRDKGLGPALGPLAGDVAQACFREIGYRVWCRPSPWQLGNEHRVLASALVDGWEQAATEQLPEQEETIAAWAGRRRHDLTRYDVGLTVGHVDLLALPTELI